MSATPPKSDWGEPLTAVALSADDARALAILDAMAMADLAPQQQHETHQCVCFSGLTDTQTRLLKLVGVIEALNFPMVDAIAAVEAAGPDHDAELATYLRRLQSELAWTIEHLNATAWPSGRTR